MRELAIAPIRNDVNMTPFKGSSIRRKEQPGAVRMGTGIYGFDSGRQ